MVFPTPNANYSDAPVSLYWVDYDCVEQPAEAIASGESRMGSTYDSHVFVLRDEATGQYIRTVRAQAVVAPGAQ